MYVFNTLLKIDFLSHVHLISLAYLKRVGGPRTVPVELGSKYTDDEWSQELMTLSAFIDKFVLPNVR